MSNEKAEFEKQIGDLRQEIKAVQDGVFKLQTTGLRESLIIIAIQKASPNVGGKFNCNPISVGTIKAIIKGISNVYDYAFPNKK